MTDADVRETTNTDETPASADGAVEDHTGAHAVAVAAAHGVDTMFTLSGAHVFPMYDGAVKADPPMRLLDVRHEQTAVFAAEAIGKLTRTPGLAVLTAGPGITNGVSPITQAYFSGAPLVVVGGRAPANRWGTGSLQELDHVPLVAPVTKSARTVHDPADIGAEVDRAFTEARSSHRGPTFLDVPMDGFFESRSITRPRFTAPARIEPDPDALADIGVLLAQLKARGVRLIDENPRIGAEGCLVAFVHPSSANGVLLELVQAKS